MPPQQEALFERINTRPFPGDRRVGIAIGDLPAASRVAHGLAGAASGRVIALDRAVEDRLSDRRSRACPGRRMPGGQR